MGTLRLFLLLLLTSAGSAAGATERDRGVALAVTTAEALSETLGPRRQAILIGIDGYQDPTFPPLLHASTDASTLGEVLARAGTGGFDRVQVLTGPEETTRAALFRVLAEAAEDLRPVDELVVYFSGHGTRVWDPAREAWRRYLLVTDSRASHLEATAVELAELQAFFASLAPHRKALIIDACFSGDGKSAVRPSLEEVPSPAAGDLAPRALSMSAGEAHLYATSAGRPSREDDRLGHGVYTYFLLEALSWGFEDADLNADAIMTAYEAHDFARSRTLTYTEGVQVPEAAFRVVGEADLVLAGDESSREERSEALVYLYQAPRDLGGARLLVDGRDRGVFPGTVPVVAGRHRLQVVDGEGRVLVDGHANLKAGRSYEATDLARMVQGPRVNAGARGLVLTSPPMAFALGDGASGVEVWGSRRVQRGPARGITRSLSAGAALSPAREPAGSEVVIDPRTVLFGHVGLGYQLDRRHLRYRAELAAGLVFLPPDYLEGLPDARPSPGDLPSEEGWLVLVAGPRLGAAWVVTDAVAVGASLRADVSWLELDRESGGRLVPWWFGTVGVEVSL